MDAFFAATAAVISAVADINLKDLMKLVLVTCNFATHVLVPKRS